LQLAEVAAFSAPKLLKIPELSTSTKVSKKPPNPPFLQTAVERNLTVTPTV
jgi:hypothetical protein